jgi:hypothetical protein
MTLTIDQLAPLVGTAFTAHTSAGPVMLQLAEAVERPRRGLPARFATPLSLLLQGPAHVRLEQDNYRLAHPALGEHVWMLVPVGGEGIPPGSYEVLLTQPGDPEGALG